MKSLIYIWFTVQPYFHSLLHIIHVSPNNVSLPVFTFLPTMFLYLYSRFSQQCFSTCIHVSPNNVSLPVFTFLPTMFLYLYSRFSQQCFSTCIHVSPNNVSLPVFTFLPTMFLYLYSRFSQQCFSTCIHVSPNNVSLPVFQNIKRERNVSTSFIIRKHREINIFDYFIILVGFSTWYYISVRICTC